MPELGNFRLSPIKSVEAFSIADNGYLAEESFNVLAFNNAKKAFDGLSTTNLGDFGVGFYESNLGWTFSDSKPTLNSLFDGGFGGSNSSISITGGTEGYFGFGYAENMNSSLGSFSELMDSNVMKWFGVVGEIAGPGISTLQAINYNNTANPDPATQFSFWGKAGSDFGFALLGATGIGTLPAAIYGLTDFTLQATGYSYTPTLHPTESGVPKTGFTGVMYSIGESIEKNQAINPNFRFMDPGKL
jgi:hypothetical protein